MSSKTGNTWTGMASQVTLTVALPPIGLSPLNMATLQLLGPVALRDDSGRDLDQLLGQTKRFALLAYLAGNAPQRFHRRDTLLALFWPESTSENARHALRQALYELRNHLGEDVIVSRGTDEIALNEETITCDVALMQTAIAQDDHERANELYCGDFLDGLFVSGAPEVEHWINNRRVEIRGQAVDVSLRLATQRETDGDLTGAGTAAQRAVALSPTNEVAVRRLIGLLERQGNSGEAFRVYDRLARELAEQFGVQPSPDTTALIVGIRENVERGQPESAIVSTSPTSPNNDVNDAASPADQGSPAFSRAGFFAIVALAVLSSIILLGQAFPGRSLDTATPIQPRWIIVAQFEGSADAAIRDAVRVLVTAALDQSPAVRTLPAENIRRGLHIAGKSAAEGLTEELAHELAVRSQVSAVFAGQVDQIGSTYAISFRAITVDSGETVVSARSIAENDDDIIPRANEAALEIVRSLEGNLDALGPTRPIVEVMTPSMAALLKYREGRMDLAIGLDSAFAEAWYWGAAYFANTNRLDSSRWAAEKALRNPERLAPSMQYAARAFIDFADHDYPATYQNNRNAWTSAGQGGRSSVNMAVTLSYMGQWDRALEAIQYTKPAPFGRSANTITNELNYMLATGKFEDTAPILEELGALVPVSSIRRWEMVLHIARGEWIEAERIAAALTSDPTTPIEQHLDAMTVEAAALANRGEFQAAAAHLMRGRRRTAAAGGLINAVSGGERNRVDGFQQRLNLLRLFGVAVHDDLVADTFTGEGLFQASLQAALAGDSARAHAYLRAFRSRPPEVVAPLASAPAVVDGVIAASLADWDSVIVTLTPMEAWTWPHRLRYGPALGGLVLTLLAQAHEAAGQLDSAVDYYEKLTSPVEFIRRWDPFSSGLVHAFARQRLVVLYARMGHVEDAERHWEIFSKTFTHPDPEFGYLANEAHETLMSANVR